MAKIHIKNLGPIQDLEFDIKNFNVFIGKQGVGKSTICKAIYFFRLLKDNLIDYLYGVAIDGKDPETNLIKAMNAKNKQVFIDIFGPSWDLPKNLEMIYIYNDIIETKVSLSDEGYINIQYEKGKNKILEIEKEMNSYHEEYSKQSTSSNANKASSNIFFSTEYRRLYNKLHQKISNIFNDNMPTYYIPAGRSLLSIMSYLLRLIYPATNFSSVDKYNALDSITKNFIDIVHKYQREFSGGFSQLHKNYITKDKSCADFLLNYPGRIISYLDGEYYFTDKDEYIVTNTGQRISINLVSSGQQEMLWILNLLYIWLVQGEKAFIIIEEPEAHLHPSMQYNIVEFVAEFANLTGSTILITTHSPYILTSADLLLYGGKLMAKHKDEVNEILEGSNKYIIPKECNVFEIVKQNSTTDLYCLKNDDYRKSLEIEKLDKISDDINEKYTKLVYLEDEIE